MVLDGIMAMFGLVIYGMDKQPSPLGHLSILILCLVSSIVQISYQIIATNFIYRAATN